MTSEKEKAKKIVDGIEDIVRRRFGPNAEPASKDDTRAQAAIKALRDERRLTREKLDRAASV